TPKVSTKGGKPAKKTAAKTKKAAAEFEIGQAVAFLGYKEGTPEDEQIFEEGERRVIKDKTGKEDARMYVVVREADSDKYDETPDDVEGAEVLASEIKKAGKAKAVKPEPEPVEVKAVGDMKSLIKKGDLLETAKTVLEDARKGF